MDAATLSVAGIIVSVSLYIYLIFRGYNIWILSVLASIIVILFSGGDVIKTITGPFMTSFVAFARSFFLLFVASAIFGRFIGDTGVAYSLGKKIASVANRCGSQKKFVACLGVPLIYGILTYSGVSVFVVVFTMMYIVRDLFKELDIPWHFYGFGIFGSATFTTGMLPGSPQIQNLVPMKYLGTTAMAAPKLGIVMSIIMIILAVAYMKYMVDRSIKRDEHYIDTGKGIEEYFAASGIKQEDREIHSLWKCLLPLPVPIVVMNYFKLDPAFALAVAVIFIYLLFRNEFTNVKKSINEATISAFSPVLSVCAAAGFGGVVASTPGFKLMITALSSIPGPASLQLALAVFIGAAIAGSASAGQTIALDALAKQYLPLVDAEVTHRLLGPAACAGSLLPHNGALFSAFAILRLTHKQIYPHYFWIGCCLQLIVMLIGVFLGEMGLK
jgi:H+/gluconate symporter-like permease